MLLVLLQEKVHDFKGSLKEDHYKESIDNAQGKECHVLRVRANLVIAHVQLGQASLCLKEYHFEPADINWFLVVVRLTLFKCNRLLPHIWHIIELFEISAHIVRALVKSIHSTLLLLELHFIHMVDWLSASHLRHLVELLVLKHVLVLTLSQVLEFSLSSLIYCSLLFINNLLLILLFCFLFHNLFRNWLFF